MKKAIIYAIIVIMISACSPMNSENTGKENNVDGNQVAYGLLGPGPINYGFIRDDADEYRYDGYINQTPSFKTLDRHRIDLGDDEDKIRSILAEEEGVTPGTVFILGKDVWVNATLDTKDKKEIEKKKKELQKVLSKAMQRYDIHLRMNQ